MSETMSVKESKTFLDGTLLWVELEDPETGEIVRKSGKELDEWKEMQCEQGTAARQADTIEEG